MNLGAVGSRMATRRATCGPYRAVARGTGGARRTSARLCAGGAAVVFMAGRAQEREHPKGLERIRQAVTKHGWFSRARIEERRQTRSLLRRWRDTMEALNLR